MCKPFVLYFLKSFGLHVITFYKYKMSSNLSERDLISQVVIDTVGTSTTVTKANIKSKHKKILQGTLIITILASVGFLVYYLIKKGGGGKGPPGPPAVSQPPNPTTAASTDTYTMVIPSPIVPMPVGMQLIAGGEVWPISALDPPIDPGANSFHRMSLSYYQSTATVSALGGNVTVTGSLAPDYIVNAVSEQPNTTDFVDLTSPFVYTITNPPPTYNWHGLQQILRSHNDANDQGPVSGSRVMVVYQPKAQGYIALGDFAATYSQSPNDPNFTPVQSPADLNINLQSVGLVPKYMTCVVPSPIHNYNLAYPFSYDASQGGICTAVNWSICGQNYALPACYITSARYGAPGCYTCYAAGATLLPQNDFGNDSTIAINRYARYVSVVTNAGFYRAMRAGNSFNIPMVIYRASITNSTFYSIGKWLNIDPLLLFHCNKTATGFLNWLNSIVTPKPASDATDDYYVTKAILPTPLQIWAPDIANPVFVAHPEWSFDSSFYPPSS